MRASVLVGLVVSAWSPGAWAQLGPRVAAPVLDSLPAEGIASPSPVSGALPGDVPLVVESAGEPQLVGVSYGEQLRFVRETRSEWYGAGNASGAPILEASRFTHWSHRIVARDVLEFSPMCETPCVLGVQPGEFRLYTRGVASHSLESVLTVPPEGLRVRMRSVSSAAADAGTLIAVAGGLGVVVGVAIMLVGATEASNSEPAMVRGGNGLLLDGGATLGIAGGVFALGLTFVLLNQPGVERSAPPPAGSLRHAIHAVSLRSAPGGLAVAF